MASDNGWSAATATRNFYPVVGSGKEEREWIELEPFHDGDQRREFRFIGGWRGQYYPPRLPFVNLETKTEDYGHPNDHPLMVIANKCLPNDGWVVLVLGIVTDVIIERDECAVWY